MDLQSELEQLHQKLTEASTRLEGSQHTTTTSTAHLVETLQPLLQRSQAVVPASLGLRQTLDQGRQNLEQSQQKLQLQLDQLQNELHDRNLQTRQKVTTMLELVRQLTSSFSRWRQELSQHQLRTEKGLEDCQQRTALAQARSRQAMADLETYTQEQLMPRLTAQRQVTAQALADLEKTVRSRVLPEMEAQVKQLSDQLRKAQESFQTDLSQALTGTRERNQDDLAESDQTHQLRLAALQEQTDQSRAQLASVVQSSQQHLQKEVALQQSFESETPQRAKEAQDMVTIPRNLHKVLKKARVI